MSDTLRLGNELLRSAARLNRWASRNASLGVPFAQVRLLALLEELGAARVSDVARADHSSQPTATAGIQRLEAAGWAERLVDARDGRASIVRLTPAGQDALAGARAARASALEPVLAELRRLDPAALNRVAEAVTVIEQVLALAAAPSPVTT
jgi:DNA-binding MarR family transcriptional regulator